MRQAIQKGGIEDLESIRAAVEASGSLDYTAQLARDYVARAIDCLEALPASEYRDALVELERVRSRSYALSHTCRHRPMWEGSPMTVLSRYMTG